MEATKVVAAARAGKAQQGFKTINFLVSPENYRVFRMRAVEYGVTVSDVCRMALGDEVMWKRAAKLKAQKAKEKEGQE